MVPMLPNKPPGVPRVNDRRVLNGIFWVLRSGALWRDLPQEFGLYHLLQSLRSLASGWCIELNANAIATVRENPPVVILLVAFCKAKANTVAASFKRLYSAM